MRRLLTAALGALAVALAACGGPSGGSVTLRVGDQSGVQQALLQASGALAGTPYTVQWAEFPAAAPLLQALGGGAIDVGVAGDAPTLNALAATPDITVVAGNHSPAFGGLAILVPANSPIKTVADLRGRTVSPTTQGSIGHYLLLQALGTVGLGASDVRISFLQPVDAGAALRSGSIDAWSTWDPYTAVAQQQGNRILRDAAGLGSGLSFLDANNESLAKPEVRAAMSDFVRRYDTALRWAKQNPARNTELYGQLTHRPAEVAGLVAQRSLRDPVPLDAALVSQLQQVADNYLRYGVLRQHLDVGSRVQDISPPGPKTRSTNPAS